ncbi:uncharacterized protein SCHCODRAFT_02509637 [Schizophyllum commune H4-8]|uniref:LysM domain-containing protein n=1 Tax=Schizophyllum commune (strain H4-8 / FGSC 9210) TaxID=578458 RepID=D8QBH9_SCHCM|nr:uncharacterized protein SCHCODRAFT_02509637 [Schizophyllum commune H4-8]KAI5889183.1 hypothetical protein SCHCODRAFT_02509637 [Schizophyllum commune H4-8]
MPGGADDLAADPTFNPFADDLDEEPQGHPSPLHYASLLDNDDSCSSGTEGNEPAQHRRAATDVPALTTSSSHPLHTADLSNENITRPTLGKALSDLEPDVGLGTTLREEIEVDANEKLVLVHEVQPKDSLASVSIKYGIAMNDLRRANSMWANDSIHLRKVLYIPIDKASRLPKSCDIPSDDNPSRSNPELSITPADGPIPDIPGHATLRRIPTSRLSYFPPQSPSSLSPRTSLDSSFPQPLQRHARSSTTPASTSSSPPTMASLLNAFPIRLSFESTTSTSTTDSEEHVELTDVKRSHRKKSSATLRYNARAGLSDAPQLSNGHALPQAGLPVPAPAPTPASLVGSPGRRVRTSQMEPEPGMMVPPPASRRRGSVKDAAAGKRATNTISDGPSSKKNRASLWDVFGMDDSDATLNQQEGEMDLEDVL